MHQSPAEPLKRQLTAFGLWLLAINGMIGAGIFGLPASVEALAGPFSPWLFLLCALLIAPIMLCFAELASAYSNTGGPVLYAGTAFGPFVGFQAGWAFYIARLTAFSANLNLLVVSFGYFWPPAASGTVKIVLLTLACAVMVIVNIVGARAAMASLGTLTLLKLLPLVAFAVYGAQFIDAELIDSARDVPSTTDLGAALILAIYAFVGFESSVVPAGEARNPQQDLPRALLVALIVCGVLYALIQVAAQSLVPGLATTERPLLVAGEAWVGPIGALIVAIGIIVSVAGNLVGSMFSTPRISYRMALDGHLPRWFGVVHERHATPANSILFYGLLALLLAISGTFVWLAVLSVLTRLLLYVVCISSMPAVRRAAGASQGFRLPGGWLIPMIAILVCLGLLTRVEWLAVLATVGMLAVGSLLYWIAARAHRHPGRVP